MKCGELLNLMPKAHAGGWETKNNLEIPAAGKNEIDESDDEEEPPQKPKLEVAKEMGFNKNQVSQFQTLADNPDIVHQTIGRYKITGEKLIPKRNNAQNHSSRQSVKKFSPPKNFCKTPANAEKTPAKLLQNTCRFFERKKGKMTL